MRRKQEQVFVRALLCRNEPLWGSVSADGSFAPARRHKFAYVSSACRPPGSHVCVVLCKEFLRWRNKEYFCERKSWTWTNDLRIGQDSARTSHACPFLDSSSSFCCNPTTSYYKINFRRTNQQTFHDSGSFWKTQKISLSLSINVSDQYLAGYIEWCSIFSSINKKW